jgi:hypothetical protein
MRRALSDTRRRAPRNRVFAPDNVSRTGQLAHPCLRLDECTGDSHERLRTGLAAAGRACGEQTPGTVASRRLPLTPGQGRIRYDHDTRDCIWRRAAPSWRPGGAALHRNASMLAVRDPSAGHIHGARRRPCVRGRPLVLRGHTRVHATMDTAATRRSCWVNAGPAHREEAASPSVLPAGGGLLLAGGPRVSYTWAAPPASWRRLPRRRASVVVVLILHVTCFTN